MDLIIGCTSQISHFLPEKMVRISSRDCREEIFDTSWENVYLAFAEQRTRHSNDSNFKDDFYHVNVNMTLKFAERLKSKRVIYYSTVELWNNIDGAISLVTPFNFTQNYYTDTKYIATDRLSKMENVKILFPFNFNSTFRSEDYLFGKVVSSILNRKKIEVVNLDMKRDILHAKYVADQSVKSNGNAIIGSGTFCNVRTFIKDLYVGCGLNMHDFLIENQEPNRHSKLLYLQSEKILYSYENLLKDTIDDIQSTAGQRHNQ